MKRFPHAATVSSKVLGGKLNFPNGITAQNRFMKAAMTERLATYSLDDFKNHGLPTEQILNIYDKWGHGQFGMIITGNVCVDPVCFLSFPFLTNNQFQIVTPFSLFFFRNINLNDFRSTWRLPETL